MAPPAPPHDPTADGLPLARAPRVFVPSEARPPPSRSVGAAAWMKENLFSTPLNVAITLVSIALFLVLLWYFVDWALVRAVWGDVPAEACKVAGAGACWGFVTEKLRFIMFGLYPPEEQWRVLLATGLITGMVITSCFPNNWSGRVPFQLIAATVLVGTLLWGLATDIPERNALRFAGEGEPETFPRVLQGTLIALAVGFGWIVCRLLEIRSNMVWIGAVAVFLAIYAGDWEPYAPSYVAVEREGMSPDALESAARCQSRAERLRADQPTADLTDALEAAGCTDKLRRYLGFDGLTYRPSQVDPDSIYGLHDALGLDLSALDHAIYFVTYTIPDVISWVFVQIGNLLVPLLNLLVLVYNWVLGPLGLIGGPLTLVILLLVLVAWPAYQCAREAADHERPPSRWRILAIMGFGLSLFALFGFAYGWLGGGSDVQDAVALVLSVALVAATVAVPFGLLMMLSLKGSLPLLAYLWIVTLAVAGVLMWGGIFELSPQKTTDFGGIALTIGLTLFGFVGAFPIAVLAALGRRSTLPVVRWTSIIYIETIRGVPLITLLIMSSIMLPLFLPEGVSIDKLLRAQIAIILFMAAYFAEVVRAGLQSLPKGQYEAADAMGLTYWQKTRLIILPQALAVTIPSMVNSLLSLFKDTTLVVVIGLYDLLLAAKTALTDREWLGFYLEAYVFLAIIYWIFCFAMSRYSMFLEHRVNASKAR